MNTPTGRVREGHHVTSQNHSPNAGYVRPSLTLPASVKQGGIRADLPVVVGAVFPGIAARDLFALVYGVGWVDSAGPSIKARITGRSAPSSISVRRVESSVPGSAAVGSGVPPHPGVAL